LQLGARHRCTTPGGGDLSLCHGRLIEPYPAHSTLTPQ
jgi:hypothetical protein